MRKSVKYICCLLIIAITGLVSTACITMYTSLNSVSIRTYNNITSVIAGGTLSMSATGRDIQWTVSSARDGTGTVAEGTYISNGRLYVAFNETLLSLYVTAVSEYNNLSDFKQIRVVTVSGITISAPGDTIALGRTLQFRAQVLGTNNPDNNVTWTVSSDASGIGQVYNGTNINSQGVLTVSKYETFRTLYITAASMVDTSKSGSVYVYIVVPTVTQVTVSPLSQSVRAGSSMQFSASVAGTYDPVNTVTWRVSSNPAGTGAVTPGTGISANGLLRVASDESLPVLYVIATSVYDTTKSGSISVTVVKPTVTSVTVSPAGQNVTVGGTLYFTAAVSGANNPDSAVTWRVSTNAAGTGAVTPGTRIDPNGLLTVSGNETVRTLYVFATSVFDRTKSGSVIATVIPAPIAPPTTPTTPPSTTPPPPTTQTPQRPQIPDRPQHTPTQPPPRTPPVTTPPTTPPTTTPPTTTPPATTPPTTTPPTTPPETTPPAEAPTVTGVSISPSSITTQTNRTHQLTAAVTGTNNPGTGVTWRVGSNPDGTGAVANRTTVSANGLLNVAPNEWNPTLYVIATSAADTAKRGVTVVTVTNANPNQGPNQGR